jgi:hypothetical protein
MKRKRPTSDETSSSMDALKRRPKGLPKEVRQRMQWIECEVDQPVTLAGKECYLHHDGCAYSVCLRGTKTTISWNENKQKAIELATEALRQRFGT